MIPHIRNNDCGGYTSHDVYLGDLYVGCYWKTPSGDWQVEMSDGSGWDMIESCNEALDTILENA
jgi:hypothetical protein